MRVPGYCRIVLLAALLSASLPASDNGFAHAEGRFIAIEAKMKKMPTIQHSREAIAGLKALGLQALSATPPGGRL